MPSLKGLVLWHTFEADKIENSKVKDRSAWENHGTFYGVGKTEGRIGKSRSFDGVDDYVKMPLTASLDITDEFTIEAWVKQDDISGRQTVWCGGNINGHTKNYAAIVEGKPILDQYLPPGGYLVSSTVLTVGKWYHLVFVQTTSWRGIYINGELDVSDTSPETYTGDPVEEWDIGRRYSTTPFNYFNGSIDEVRIYDRALSADEVRRHFQEKQHVQIQEEAKNLAGLWIPEISVNTSTLKDLSRWENHGSIIGATWKRADPGEWALEFDGMDDYVEVADDPSLKPDDVSFELWIKTSDDTYSRQFLMNKYHWIENAWGIQIVYNKAYIFDDVGGVDKAYAAVPIEINTWYHLVATMSSKENRLYLNGELKSYGVYSRDTLATVPGSLFLGQRGGNAYYFKGLISEVRIYGRALLATEIKDRFESQRSRYGV